MKCLRTAALAALAAAFIGPAQAQTVTLKMASATINDVQHEWLRRDRKSTRLNSSHVSESRMPSSA